MAEGEPPTATAMAELMRLLQLSQAEALSAQAKVKLVEDRATAAAAETDLLRAERNAQPRTAADYLKPTVRMAVTPLVLPAVPDTYRDLRPSQLTLIKSVHFSGNPFNTSECSLKHLKDYLDICDTIASNEAALEFVRMKAFKFTLGGNAAEWYARLPAKSIHSWEQLSDFFTDKFFPVHKTKEGRRKIYEFDQGAREPLDVAWERFKSPIYACPTHKLPLYQLISIFYEGMNEHSRARINNHSHNKFIRMEPEKAWELMDELTTFDAQFGPRIEQEEEAYDMRDLVQSLKAC